MGKKILISCPLSFDVRNFVGTGLVAEMKQQLNADLTVVSSFSNAEVELTDGSIIPNIHVPSDTQRFGVRLPKEVKRFDEILRSIHSRGFSQEYPDGSIGMMILNDRSSKLWWVGKILCLLAPRSGFRREILRRINHAITPKRRYFSKIFDAVCPELLVVSSPGHSWLDFLLMREAARRHVPCLCIVMSWDNLYSRGPMYRRPDILGVWSAEMKRQAIEVHQFPNERIHVVGAMQFLYYDQPVSNTESATMRVSLGLDPLEPYIAYVAGSRTTSYDCEDIMAMHKALQGTEFANLQIVVRPHPQANPCEYDSLKYLGVLFDTPPDATSSENPQKKGMNRAAARHMAALLSNAEFVVSSWGTTALLEACIFDRPAVQFRWMDAIEHSNQDEIKLVRQFQRYIHMRVFDSFGARVYSDSPLDLPDVFRALRDNAVEYGAKRKALVEHLVALPLHECKKRIISAAIDCFSHSGGYPSNSSASRTESRCAIIS